MKTISRQPSLLGFGNPLRALSGDICNPND